MLKAGESLPTTYCQLSIIIISDESNEYERSYNGTLGKTSVDGFCSRDHSTAGNCQNDVRHVVF